MFQLGDIMFQYVYSHILNNVLHNVSLFHETLKIFYKKFDVLV